MDKGCLCGRSLLANDPCFPPGKGTGNRFPFLERSQARCQKIWKEGEGQTQVGDAGFLGEGVEEGDIIPPIRRGGNLVSPERIARQELVAAARLDGIYGQRWKSETVSSVIKRKFGDVIRSRKERRKMREPAIKGLVYNIHR
jgi:hypothetical protein